MKLLATDWEGFLRFLEPWEGLTPAGRRFLLDAKPKTLFARRALGGELARLLEGGFVTAPAAGERVQLAEAFHETHKVLRALERHPLCKRSDPHALREYLGAHFTQQERTALAGSRPWIPNQDARMQALVASAGHVRGFLAAEEKRAWERQRLPRGFDGSPEREWTQSRSLLKGAHAAGDLEALIRTLRASRTPIPFRSLQAPAGSRACLAAAIQAGLRYLLCFPAFDAELVPVLMLWPAVSERLHRAATPPPSSAAPVETFTAIRMLEDLVQFLVRGADPLRLKQNGWTLFAAAQRELADGFHPLPTWLLNPKVFPEHAPERRVREVQRLAAELGSRKSAARAVATSRWRPRPRAGSGSICRHGSVWPCCSTA